MSSESCSHLGASTREQPFPDELFKKTGDSPIIDKPLIWGVCICTYSSSSIRQGLSWLLKEAGPDIAFITRPPALDKPYIHEHMLAFYEACFELGARLMPDLIFKSQYRDFMTDMPLIVSNIFERAKHPKGIFIPCCDFIVPFVLCATTKYRKELGKDYFLLSIDTIPELQGKQGMTFLKRPYHLFQREIENWLKHCANMNAHLSKNC